MYRQGPDSPQSFAGHDIPKASGEVRRRAKKLPAGSQLPDGWNEDMDRAICHMDALNDIDPKKIPGVLKRRFPDIIGRVSDRCSHLHTSILIQRGSIH